MSMKKTVLVLVVLLLLAIGWATRYRYDTNGGGVTDMRTNRYTGTVQILYSGDPIDA